jgi:hypothetical protein
MIPDPNNPAGPPPAEHNDPLPIDEPGTTIPIKDPAPTPDNVPGDEPIIDPPLAQAN